MVLGFIVHYITAMFQKITSTPTHASAYKQKNKKIEYPMFQNQIIDTCNVLLFSKYTLP